MCRQLQFHVQCTPLVYSANEKSIISILLMLVLYFLTHTKSELTDYMMCRLYSRPILDTLPCFACVTSLLCGCGYEGLLGHCCDAELDLLVIITFLLQGSIWPKMNIHYPSTTAIVDLF